MGRWTYEFDNGNWYVLYQGKAKAHFWSENLAKEYLKFKNGTLISLPKVPKPKPCPGRPAHDHSCPRCKADWRCEDRGCDGGQVRYCGQHTVLR